MTKEFSGDTTKTAYGRVEKHADDLIQLYLLDDLDINLPMAEQMVADTRAAAQSKPIRVLLVYGRNSDISFRAQRYFASVTGFKRLAFVVSSRMQAEIGQFLVSLLQTLRASYEFRLFYEVDTALAWLQEP